MTKTWMAWCLALLAAAVITASPAHAGVGLAELPGQQGDGPVTVFYPAQEADQPVQREAMGLAARRLAERGHDRRRLVARFVAVAEGAIAEGAATEGARAA